MKNSIITFIGKLKTWGDIAPSFGNPVPLHVLIARYLVLTFFLFITLFVILWWPADSFNPESYESWVNRIKQLPPEIWYFAGGVISAWLMAVSWPSGGRQGRTTYRSPNTFTNVPARDTLRSDERYGNEETELDWLDEERRK